MWQSTTVQQQKPRLLGPGRENELHIYQDYNIENRPRLKMLIILNFWEPFILTLRENTESDRQRYLKTQAVSGL
jgi:hypothetical protein